MDRMKFITCCLVAFVAGIASAAVPAAVDEAVKQMQADGAEVRAGCTKSLGVFVVASGTAEITGSKAKAKTVARVNAVKNLAGYFGTDIANITKNAYTESTVNGQAEIKEFFSSVTESKVKELLKGVQDYGTDSDGDTITAIVYLTTKGVDKSRCTACSAFRRRTGRWHDGSRRDEDLRQ